MVVIWFFNLSIICCCLNVGKLYNFVKVLVDEEGEDLLIGLYVEGKLLFGFEYSFGLGFGLWVLLRYGFKMLILSVGLVLRDFIDDNVF